MKSLITYIKFGIPGIVAGVFIATGVQLVFAWTAPAGAPPSNNTPTPINVSATNQTKAGSLTLGVSVLSPIFYDSNNSGYYVDPHSTSRFNYGVYDNLYSHGWMQTPTFYDANDNGYYVDPNSTSFLYNIYSNNWAQFNSGTVGYAAGFYGAGWSHNAQPQNANGSIYTNDVYLRSIGKWASQLGSGAPCNNTILGNLVHMQIGQVTPPSFQFCTPSTYQCINGVLALISSGVCDPGAPTCFPKGTPVLMASGEYKSIDEIKTGEEVMGMNGSTNTVRGLWRPKLGDRTLYEVNGAFKVTGDHMILAKNGSEFSWGSIEPTLYKERRYMKPAVVQDSTGGKLLISNSNIAPEALMKLSEGASLIDYRGDTVTLNSLEKVAGTSPDDQLYTLYTDNTGSFVVNGGYVVDGMPQRPLSEVLEDSDSQKQ